MLLSDPIFKKAIIITGMIFLGAILLLVYELIR